MTFKGEIVGEFVQFYTEGYTEEIESSITTSPHSTQSIHIDWKALDGFNNDIASDVLIQPDTILDAAEFALDEVIEGKIDPEKTRVRISNIPADRHFNLRNLEAQHRGELISVTGLVSRATDPKTRLSEAAFECQRCGTLTRIPVKRGDYKTPHECQGCERQGPFDLNHDQSAFAKTQELSIREFIDEKSDSKPKSITVYLRDDLVGEVTTGEAIRLTGILRLAEDSRTDEPVFIPYFRGHSIERVERPTAPASQSQEIEDLSDYVSTVQSVFTEHADDFREEETKAKLITPFVQALGWDKFDNSEFQLEYTDGKTDRRVDYALFPPDKDSPAVLVEAKQFGTNLDEKEPQIYDYLRTFAAEWGVLTNGEEFYLYQNSTDEELPSKTAELSINDLSHSPAIKPLTRSKVISK